MHFTYTWVDRNKEKNSPCQDLLRSNNVSTCQQQTNRVIIITIKAEIPGVAAEETVALRQWSGNMDMTHLTTFSTVCCSTRFFRVKLFSFFFNPNIVIIILSQIENVIRKMKDARQEGHTEWVIEQQLFKLQLQKTHTSLFFFLNPADIKMK